MTLLFHYKLLFKGNCGTNMVMHDTFHYLNTSVKAAGKSDSSKVFAKISTCHSVLYGGWPFSLYYPEGNIPYSEIFSVHEAFLLYFTDIYTALKKCLFF